MLNKEKLKKSEEACLKWIDSQMLSFDSGSWGIYERIRIDLNQRVPYCRPDCNSEYLRVLQEYAKTFSDKSRANTAENIKKWLLSVQYDDDKKFNYGAYPFYLVDGFLVVPEGDVIWPNDNGKIMVNLVDAYRDTGEKKLLDSAKRTADFWLKLQNADGTFGLTLEEMKEKGVNMPLARFGICYVCWLMLGLAEVYSATGEEKYYDSSYKALNYILKSFAGNRFPSVYEREKIEEWRPVSSDNAIAVYCLSKAYVIFKDEKIMDVLLKAGEFVRGLQDNTGAIMNCDEGCLQASFNNSPDIADLVYTQGFALRGFVALYEASGKKEYLKAAIRLADFLLSIQCHNENPLWDGAWRGSYDIRKKRWSGRCDQNNAIDEGGMYSVYTGWSCTNIMLGLTELSKYL